MNEELKKIKKKYGEQLMHICRELFPTILDNDEGKLSEILENKFATNYRTVGEDISENYLKSSFKSYIYNLYYSEKEDKIEDEVNVDTRTPFEILDEAGYELFECNSQDEIMSYKKYYEPGEELCTFNDERLNTHYVFFAVKKNALDIKEKNLISPKEKMNIVHQ